MPRPIPKAIEYKFLNIANPLESFSHPKKLKTNSKGLDNKSIKVMNLSLFTSFIFFKYC